MITFLLELPNGIAPSLPLIDLLTLKNTLNYILLPILIGILIYLFYYFKNSQKTIFKRVRKSSSVNLESLETRILNIKKEHLLETSFREGLHLLSREMKYFCESKTNLPVEEMTYKEIAKNIKQQDIIEFFKFLSSLQFQKTAPIENDYEECFEKALKIITKKRVDSKSLNQIEIIRPRL